MNISLKVLAASCAIFSSVVVAGIAAADPPRPPRPGFGPAIAAADFKLLRVEKSLYRFDTRTGTTEVFTPSGAGGTWSFAFTGGASPASMEVEAGRYEVAPGMGDSPRLIRIDKKTGRTWGLTSTPALPMPVVRWHEYVGAGAPAADFTLLKVAGTLYRYDTKTGTTEVLALNGAAATWSSMFAGGASPASMAGEAGRYEVVEGNGDAPRLFRTDKKTGKTWGLTVTPAVPMPIVRWQELTAR